MALHRGRLAFLVLFVGVIAGCNSQVAPVGTAPGGGAATDDGSTVPDGVAGGRSAPVNVPPASNEPGPSGKDFTIWDAKKVGGNIELHFRRDNASGGGRERYRLLVEQSGADTIYSDLRVPPGRAGVGAASKISLGLMFTGLKDGGHGATLRIVKVRGFGLGAADEAPEDASNVIQLEVPAGLAGAGGGGNGGGGSGSANMAPEKINPELQMPDDMPWGARDPWATLRQEFGKAKIAVLRLEGGEKVNLAEGVLERIAAYKKNHPEAKIFEVLDKDKPVILIAPTTDFVATAKEFGLGTVERTDSFQGVAFVKIDDSLFKLNDSGIVEDESHPEFFDKNFALLEKYAIKNQFGELEREAGPSIKRLAKADPADCPEAIREKVNKRFQSLFNAENHFFDKDIRRSVIEGYALWDPKSAGPDLTSELRELARENFFARDDEGELIMEQLGKLQEVSAVDTLADIIGSTADFGRHHDKMIEPAADALIAIGAPSEDAAFKLVKHDNEDICLTGIRILEEIGTKKSLGLLGKASTESRNSEVRDTAKGAMRAIRMREAGK